MNAVGAGVIVGVAITVGTRVAVAVAVGLVAVAAGNVGLGSTGEFGAHAPRIAARNMKIKKR